MVTLAEKLRFLGDPAAYGGATQAVDCVETHMSWVFLTDSLVYKLKKPVRYSYLDFSSVEKRRRACLDELSLNRRLADEVYRAVVPLCRGDDGRLAIGGQGRAIDWLVEMTRLQAEEMMDARIAAGTLVPAQVRKLGRHLANFYAQATPEIAGGRAYIRHLQEEHAVNRDILLGCGHEVRAAALPLVESFDHIFDGCRAMVEERIDRGIIVEGHGDMRPEHVCLDGEPLVIDCLEFSRPMRILDPYDEVNYLGLECQALGAGWVRGPLLGALRERIGHPPSPELFGFYTLFRCLLRARLCMAHLLEPKVRLPDKWQPLALAWLTIARGESFSLPCREDPKSTRSRRGA